MRRQIDLGLVGEDDSPGAVPQSILKLSNRHAYVSYHLAQCRGDATHQWYDLCRFRYESVGQILVVLDQVTDVDVAIELLQQSVLLKLISVRGLDACASGLPPRMVCAPVDEFVIEPEREDELLQLLLDLEIGVFAAIETRIEHVRRVYRLAIHVG